MNETNINDYLYTSCFGGANIALSDVRFILPVLYELKPRVIVEIGTYLGGSARLWAKLFCPDILITIDCVKMTSINLPNVTYLHDVQSQNPDTVAEVKRLLSGRDIDMLFIDGGHLYDEVKADFDLYSPLVRQGGVIMFHDIYLDRPGRVEVTKYWQELKQMYKHIQSQDKDGVAGLGVVYI